MEMYRKTPLLSTLNEYYESMHEHRKLFVIIAWIVIIVLVMGIAYTQTLSEPTNSDTWRVIKGFNPTVIEWPNQLHWRINAQTNGWWINSNFLRHASLSANKKTTFHQINSDGTLSFELVMEFWPQRLFYAGGIISIAVLLTTLIVLFLRWIRQQFIPKSL